MDPIITLEQLNTMLKTKEVTILDTRSELTNPDEGEAAYKEAHIPGAYYLHLENDLSGKKGTHGGNHPLPDMESFAAKLQKMGVSAEKPVIVYDETNGMFAARAWWLLEYAGHPQVYLLEGGFEAWKEAGYDVTDSLPEQKEGDFTADVQTTMTRSMEEVKERGKKVLLLDSRAPARYRGETEPMYNKAGHIPGAVNYFWKEVLDEEGSWRGTAELQDHFKNLEDADEIVVSCGSGISACPNIAALKRAGFKNVKLYPGSYSDWISYADNPVETGEE